ncbi:MAG: D-alanyl-D-alanine carboxypeptidase family protein [Blastocatellia bacterium]
MFKSSSRRVVPSATLAAAVFLMALSSVAAGSTNKSTRRQRPISIKSRPTANQSKGPAARSSKASSSGAACDPCSMAGKAKPSLNKGAKWAKDSPCHPKGYVDPKIAKNFNAAMQDLRRAGIKPEVTSVWRSSQDQARLHNCSASRSCRKANPGLYRALPPGQSLHEAGLAVDMSGIAAGPRGAKRLTPRGRRIVGIMRKNGFKWRYGLADPAHFEADPRRAGYRNLRQAIARSQNTCDAKIAGNIRADRSARRAHQQAATARRVASIKQPPAQVGARRNARALAGR